MNLQNIAANFRKFQRCDLDGWGGPLDNVMEALFGELIKLGYNTSFRDLLDRPRTEVYTLFDLPHSSGDSCELHVLVVDDKPVGIAFKFADKSEWQARIIDADHFKAVARELAAIAMDLRLKDVTDEELEELRVLKNDYIFFLDKEETMFAVRCPKGMYGFSRLPEKHRAFFVDKEGKAHPVSTIGNFCNTKVSHCWDEDTNDVFITVNGVERTVDGSQLMFELVPGEGKVEAAVECYAKEPFWFVEGVHSNEKINRVELLAQYQNRWSSSQVWFDFASAEELKRFAAKYFDHEKEILVKAPVCLKTLGFEATLNAIHH